MASQIKQYTFSSQTVDGETNFREQAIQYNKSDGLMKIIDNVNGHVTYETIDRNDMLRMISNVEEKSHEKSLLKRLEDDFLNSDKKKSNKKKEEKKKTQKKKVEKKKVEKKKTKSSKTAKASKKDKKLAKKAEKNKKKSDKK